MNSVLPTNEYEFKDGIWYWHGRICKGADNQSFVPHNNVWATDKKGLFKQDTRVRLRDPATCEVLNLLFAKDSQQVYYIDGIAKGVANVASFEVLDSGCYTTLDGFVRRFGFARDSMNVYSHDFFSGAPKVLKGADRNTFRRLDYGYAADENSVWNDAYRIKKADPKSFVVIDDAYSQDLRHVYCGDSLIVGADKDTFEIIGFRVAVDAQHVFYGVHVIPGADPNSFGMDPDNSLVGRDATHVFIGEKPVPGADPDTFDRIGDSCYYRDRYTIYHMHEPVAGVDAASFEVIGHMSRGKDKYREYHAGKPVEK
jgi:hypothetical protein